jgi:hypothetical protein
MTDKPTVKSAEPESPPHSPKSNPPPTVGSAPNAWAVRVTASPPATAPRMRPRWKKILVPTVLAVLGAGLIVAAWGLYPRRGPVAGVTGATVEITGSSPYINDHIQLILYDVQQARPGVARVEVDVQLDGPPYVNEAYTRIPRGAYAEITLYAGAKMLDCSAVAALIPTPSGRGCTPGETVGLAWPQFQPPTGFGLSTATAVFYVRARSYEVAANGATAAVGFPEVDSTETHPADLQLEYQNFPTASAYDWSTFPGGDFSKSLGATWSETVQPGNPVSGAVASARVATAVNPTAQQHDSNLILAVGVLFGIGGSALVAAAQEALHD